MGGRGARAFRGQSAARPAPPRSGGGPAPAPAPDPVVHGTRARERPRAGAQAPRHARQIGGLERQRRPRPHAGRDRERQRRLAAALAAAARWRRAVLPWLWSGGEGRGGRCWEEGAGRERRAGRPWVRAMTAAVHGGGARLVQLFGCTRRAIARVGAIVSSNRAAAAAGGTVFSTHPCLSVPPRPSESAGPRTAGSRRPYRRRCPQT